MWKSGEYQSSVHVNMVLDYIILDLNGYGRYSGPMVGVLDSGWSLPESKHCVFGKDITLQNLWVTRN